MFLKPFPALLSSFFFPYLVVFDAHILLAELKNGLPGAHVQSVPFLAQQQRGVVEDVRLGKLHQIQVWGQTFETSAFTY